MKLGIFFEQSVSPPFTRESERRVFKQSAEQVVLADSLGYDSVWVVEHQFLPSYSHSAAPEVFLAYVAGQTTQIRLGHGVRILLPEVNHPVRVAAQAAYLDCVSDGRLEFGTGRLSTWTELGGFNVEPDTTKDVWDEIVRVIPKMWTEEEVEWHGKWFDMPPRNVLPKPYQDPHPPMWVAVGSPDTAVQAAERGLGYLGLSFSGPARYAAGLRDYRRIIQQCDPVGKTVNNRAYGTTWMYCAETDEKAMQEGAPAARAFFEAASRLVGIGSMYPSPAYGVGASAVGAAVEPSDRPDMPIGSPETCIKALQEWQAIGMDGMTFLIGYDNVTPHEKIMDSLRLFAREVMPAFAEEPANVSR